MVTYTQIARIWMWSNAYAITMFSLIKIAESITMLDDKAKEKKKLERTEYGLNSKRKQGSLIKKLINDADVESNNNRLSIALCQNRMVTRVCSIQSAFYIVTTHKPKNNIVLFLYFFNSQEESSMRWEKEIAMMTTGWRWRRTILRGWMACSCWN